MSGIPDRHAWLLVLEQLAGPMLSALAEGRLKASMPVESYPAGSEAERARSTHLEGVARLLAGIAPWLELGTDETEEGCKRAYYGELARAALRVATDPAAPDYLNFAEGLQPVVDMGFLAQAILRAPNELWVKLDADTKENLSEALGTTRTRLPCYSNWLLFSGIVEAAFYKMGRPFDPMRVDYALRQHEQWYVGDGAYSDGPQFHWDYYNSFVIHPMLVDIARTLGSEPDFVARQEPILRRARRYAAVLERFISPEGTFPPIGRSLAYRCAALQSLGQAALLHFLPEALSPGGVRAAMTAVIMRMMGAPGTFDPKGWLRIGFCGAQPRVAESYISTGSLYLCATGLLPLGLPANDPFWTEPAQPWTQKRIWSGEDLPADHAMLITADGATLYDAGDTALTLEMKLLGEQNKIDVALLPIGDNFTMGPDDAALAAEFLRCGLAIPIHYNTFELIEQDPHTFVQKVEARGLRAKALAIGESHAV